MPPTGHELTSLTERRSSDADLHLTRTVLGLHVRGQSVSDITASLEQMVPALGLAEEAVYVPASAVEEADQQADQQADLVCDVRTSQQVLMGWLHCRGAAPGQGAAIRAVAAHAGRALAGVGRLNEVEHQVAGMQRVSEALQDALLPKLPDLPHTTMAVSYRAAGRDAKVGGDFYDVAPLPNGQVLIVVGDVVGKGIEAAVHTSLITQTLRALALAGLPLDHLLERADRQVRWQRDELIATLWCGLYHPDTGELAFASLGHPPALLLRASGDPVRLELHGLPLGLRELSPEPPEVRSRLLESRDLLVLYTDGVVEAHRDFLAGQEALLQSITKRRDEPLNESIERSLDELLMDAGHADDAVMFLLRRR